MQKNTKERRIIILKYFGAVITATAGMLLLIYIAFFGAVMNTSFLRDVNIELGIHDELGMSEEDLEKVVNSMVFFSKGEQDTLQVRVTMNGVEQDFYNDKEIAHIEDVRELVQKVRIFVIVCGAICLAGIVWLCRIGDADKLAKGYFISLGIALVSVLVIAIVAVVDMQALVNGFHYLFFDNDLWLLSYKTDKVVWLFTNDMYGDAIVRIGIWLATLLIPVTVLAAIIISKKSPRRKELHEKHEE